MVKNLSPPQNQSSLLQEEEYGRESKAWTGRHHPNGSDRLLEDLQIYQEELETQNERLKAALSESECSRGQLENLNRQFTSLFDFAPVGYLAVDSRDKIIEANITFAAMVGFPRGALVGQQLTDFVFRDEKEAFHLHRIKLTAGQKENCCDLRLKKADGTHFLARLQSQIFEDALPEEKTIRIAVSDITDQICARKRSALIQRCLELANQRLRLGDLLKNVVMEIKTSLGCEALGIRLLDETGCIPYHACEGFSRSFYEAESPLSIQTDQCMCINVLRGETDPEKPFFTRGGSFFVNAATRLLATFSKDAGEPAPNFCHRYGYESVALVPICLTGMRMGLIHAADHRENIFPLETVETLEELAGHLGIIINRVILSEQLMGALAELRLVSSQLLQAQEDEQERISVELHDQLGQDLNYLKLRLSTFYNQLPVRQKKVRANFEKTLAFTDQLIENVRNLSHGLSPSILKDLGLVVALEGLLEDFAGQTGITVFSDLAAIGKTAFDFKTRIVLHRIVQELLSNVRKHANAAPVRVSTRHQEGQLEIRLKDDGQGFSCRRKGQAATMNRGVGLSAMHLRARLVHATLTLESSVGRGTEAILRLPLQRENNTDGHLQNRHRR